jgi:peptide/nickel transport system substrate-binding protein
VTIDEAFWPSYDLNVLLPGLTYPNWFEYSVYQPLVSIDAAKEYSNQGYDFLPGLASNWTVSHDGTTYTFNLRTGVTFSNGDPFNSYQVWLNFYDLYFSVFNGTFFFSYPTIFNTQPIVFGPHTIAMINASGLNSPTAAVVSLMSNSSWPIYVNGPNQIIFHMTVPFTGLLGLLNGLPGMLYDAGWALGHGWPALYGSPALGYFSTHLIPGTGPYVMTDFGEMSHVTLSMNPTYWGNSMTPAQIAENPLLDPGHVKQVIIQYKPDDLARYTDLSDGSAQISTVEAQNWNLVSSNPNTYGWVTFPSSANIVSSLAFNTLKWPMNITDVRLAIEHAINYTQLDQSVFHGNVHPYFGPETPGFSQYYDVGGYQQYSFNVTLANHLKALANIPTSRP